MSKKETHLNIDRINIVFHNACSYKNIFYNSLKNVLDNNSNILNKDPEDLWFSSTVVNGLFAAELFLKYLYAMKNIKNGKTTYLKSHAISKLFRILPKETKKILNAKMGNNLNNFISKINKSNTSNSNIYGDPIGWRYMNGSNTIYNFDFNLLIKFINILYIESKKLLNNQINANKFISEIVCQSPILDDESLKIINNENFEEDKN